MKGILQTPGVRNIKSIHSVGARSIPKVQRSSYLELYALGREKDRLVKEIIALEQRKETAQRQLGSINVRIESARKEIHEQQQVGPNTRTHAKPLKTMAINY